MPNERIDWLDVGKGLGMVLVILAHSNIPTIVRAEIYAFHMPLFFFLSGYLFLTRSIQILKRFFLRSLGLY